MASNYVCVECLPALLWPCTLLLQMFMSNYERPLQKALRYVRIVLQTCLIPLPPFLPRKHPAYVCAGGNVSYLGLPPHFLCDNIFFVRCCYTLFLFTRRAGRPSKTSICIWFHGATNSPLLLVFRLVPCLDTRALRMQSAWLP